MTTTKTTTSIIPVVLISPHCPHNHLNQMVINLVRITRSPKYVEAKADGGTLTVEVASSFRPAVSSRLDYGDHVIRSNVAPQDKQDLSCGAKLPQMKFLLHRQCLRQI